MKKKLIYTSLALFILSFVSKILAFVKEILLAHYYGASNITDSYLMAQNIIVSIFGAFTAALVIGYITIMTDKNDENKTINILLRFLLIFFFILNIIMFIFSPIFIKLFAPGFDGSSVELTTQMMRVMLPFSLFYSFLYIFSADLQTKNNFWHIGVYMIISNIILIASIILSNNNINILSLGIGLSILIPAIFVYILDKKVGFRFSLKKKIKSDNIKPIILAAYPIFFIELFTNIMTLIDKSFASSLGEGIITDINYANRLITAVLAFFVSIISTVLLPALVKKANKEDKSEFASASSQIVIYVLLLILPIGVIFINSSQDIVNFMFYHGEFSLENSLITSSLLRIYSFALPALSINSLLKSQLYALKKSKSSMIVTIISLAANVIFDFIFIRIWNYRGLAIASVLASYILLILLFVTLFKAIKQKYNKNVIISLIKILIITVLIYLLGSFLVSKLYISNLLLRIIAIAAIEIVVYIVLLLVFRVDEVNSLIKEIVLRSKRKNEKNT